MDVLTLSRLQFAVATYFHFLFVPLTLGLSLLVAIMETMYVKTGDEEYKRITKFWGKLFLINFAIGIVTGITLEFQFGTNWSRYSVFMGDIFGSLLAIEATLAFFMESTFIAVWVFGWERLSKKMHAAAIWIVFIGSNISAFWILTANAWMQHPVGYSLNNGRAELASFLDVITNPYAFLKFFHQLPAAYTVGGFFVMGISAWHILRKSNVDFFKKSFRLAAAFTFIFAVVVVITGHLSGEEVAKYQPAKLAAMESLWNTEKPAGMSLLVIPDPANERNSVELLKIPKLLSLISHFSTTAEVKGLKAFPKDERPPVTPVFFAFRIMVGIGFLMILLAFFAWRWQDKIENYPKFMKILIWAIPLPYLAIELGWTVAEVGRQPWIVYGLMKTSHAVSTAINTPQVATSLIAFTLVYTLLGIADFYLLFTFARKGPKEN
ncbi:MAG: cytochrome ubiquinol oxidase subunit I [Acidobacteria bacterium]|nr:MAG: cytochrome ubiquinol oxidase subunit I [Acidobacteriota bacterium]RLE22454.1 MAG: cytochrome ubiquinol oxidase subunit I [Acidobacteriota bacterium]